MNSLLAIDAGRLDLRLGDRGSSSIDQPPKPIGLLESVLDDAQLGAAAVLAGESLIDLGGDASPAQTDRISRLGDLLPPGPGLALGFRDRAQDPLSGLLEIDLVLESRFIEPGSPQSSEGHQSLDLGATVPELDSLFLLLTWGFGRLCLCRHLAIVILDRFQTVPDQGPQARISEGNGGGSRRDLTVLPHPVLGELVPLVRELLEHLLESGGDRPLRLTEGLNRGPITRYF